MVGGEDLGTVLVAERKQQPNPAQQEETGGQAANVHRDSLVSILDLMQNHAAL